MIQEGLYTIETFAQEHSLTRQSAVNLLSSLKKKQLVEVKGGGAQKRLYRVRAIPQKETNGFFDIVNTYSPEKLVPQFKHYVYGKYSIEHAIIDGLLLGDVRTKEATMHLFRHIKNWKRLFDLAKEKHLVAKVQELYILARKKTKCKTMPKRYARDFNN